MGKTKIQNLCCEISGDRINERIILNCILQKQLFEMDSTSSRHSPMAGFCGDSNQTQG
jgi:hypothetical protein